MYHPRMRYAKHPNTTKRRLALVHEDLSAAEARVKAAHQAPQWTATATASKQARAQTVPAAASATYADDATGRAMESTSAAEVVTVQETVRGTEINAHMTVAVTMENMRNAADGVKAADTSH